ncbi:MAG: amidohydrolase family protein [Bryobacteraceae bacterium]
MRWMGVHRPAFAARFTLVAVALIAPETGAGQARHFSLESAAGLRLHNVSAEPAVLQGKNGLRVTMSEERVRRFQEMTSEQQLNAQARVGQYAVVEGVEFGNGVIELEIAGAPAPGAGGGSRGFAGIAFRLQNGGYDAFYLRATNGRADDQERRNHAVQYVSHPDWPWFRLRKETPSKYETYVDLVPDAWTKIKIEVRGEHARLYVHGQEQPTLIVNDLKTGDQAKGGVALWIDQGTVAYFRDLTVAPLAMAARDGTRRSDLATSEAPKVDHHQHLLSPALAKAWSSSETVTADRLIAQLDAAGIRRALVLSLAYAHGSPELRGKDEYAQVKRENDWTSEQVARYPGRLRAFCSVNPLREYALAEIDCCAKDPNLSHGLKLHFANSKVDLRNADHVAQLRQVFRAANAHRMPIVVHVWTGDQVVGRPFGRAEAQTFLNEILPAAPDIPMQIAHLGGSGPRLDPGTKEAMIQLAEAVAAADSRTRNLYFDVTTNVTAQSSAEDAAFVTARIRQIGLQRILYGSDMAIKGNATAKDSWKAYRAKLALTEAEFATIENNVAPYMR